MGTLKRFKQARNLPVPTGIPPLEFRLWNFGSMKPLQAVPYTITVGIVAQSVLDIFIPANTWADFKRLIIWADFSLQTNAPNPPGGSTYQEAYAVTGQPNTNRNAAGIIPNAPANTRYAIQRQFMYEPGGSVFEENFNTVGITSLVQAAGSDHRLKIAGIFSFFDNTVDNYLQLMLSNNNPLSANVATIHSAMAYIQSPVNLKRLV